MNEKNALLKDPMLLLLLCACPILGATTNVLAALAMGGALLLVLVLSSVILSALQNMLSRQAKLAAALLLAAGFTSVLQQLMHAFQPDVSSKLGIYLAVAAVDVMVFLSTDSRPLGDNLKNSVIAGLFLIVVLAAVAAVREVFGNASFAGMEISFLSGYKVPILMQASGGFAAFAVIAAVINAIRAKKDICLLSYADAAGFLASENGTKEEKS